MAFIYPSRRRLTGRARCATDNTPYLDARPDLADRDFIHASQPAEVALVANAFYQGVRDLVLLVIDTERVASNRTSS